MHADTGAETIPRVQSSSPHSGNQGKPYIPLFGPGIPEGHRSGFGWCWRLDKEPCLLPHVPRSRSSSTVQLHRPASRLTACQAATANFHNNAGKRLVKSPKVYIRDSSLVHALLGTKTSKDLLDPVARSSWEGCVIQNLLTVAPERTVGSFYRTVAVADIDPLLEIAEHVLWAIEVKRSFSGRLEKANTSLARILNQRGGSS